MQHLVGWCWSLLPRGLTTHVDDTCRQFHALIPLRALALSSHHFTACVTGLGWANLAGAAFNSYPTTGSFARSAVAKYTGAKSGLAGVVTAGLVGITLLCLTQVFNAMPMNALAAIVIAGVLPLLDFGRGISLFWVGLQT